MSNIKRNFENSILKKTTKDPEEWITELEELCGCLEEMESIISDEYLMIHMINILPSEYEVQVQQIKGKINQDNNPLMLEQVRSTLRLKFEIIDVSNEDDAYDKEI